RLQAPAAPPTPESQAPGISIAALTRDIQTEMRRLGCYMGTVDGVWGVGSSHATGEIERLSIATAPAGTPDGNPERYASYLRTLQSVTGRVCQATASPPAQPPARSSPMTGQWF